MPLYELQILTTQRFRRSYEDEGSLGRQLLIDGAIHDFEQRFVEDPKVCVRSYDRVAGAHTGQLLEIDVAGARRMIAHWRPGTLTLLDVGGKRIVPLAKNIDLVAALATSKPAPPHFHLRGRSALLRLAGKGFQQYANELAPDWIYHLDDEQQAAERSIYNSAVEVLLSENLHSLHILLGGPGTGKTSILLTILKKLADEAAYRIRLHISPYLREHLEACLPIDLSSFCDRSITDADVLLVDDPDRIEDVASCATQGEVASAKLIVIAFDPVQLDRSAADAQFDGLVSAYPGSVVHELRTCYRQKRNVGLAAKHIAEVIAESTPFLDPPKVKQHRYDHLRLTTLCNDLSFPNPIGYADKYPVATPSIVRQELNRIIRQPGGVWTHTAPLLVAIIDEYVGDLPVWLTDLLSQSGIRFKKVEAKSLKRIKGLEFQHAFIFAGDRLFQELEAGFRGKGRKSYDAHRLLRIPFSRAKDSVVTFGLWSPVLPN